MEQILEPVIYFGLSITVSIAAVLAAIVASMAMKKGLTYSAMATTVWTLVILAVARVWHTTYEIFNLKSKLGESVEIVEYIIYIIAYVFFIWLIYQSTKAKLPDNR